MRISKLDLELLRTRIELSNLKDNLDVSIFELDELIETCGEGLGMMEFTSATRLPSSLTISEDFLRSLIKIRQDLLELTYSTD